MPGLGGVGFTDKRAPEHGFTSVTPYIQLYCQEKVPTYAPFGSKARGAYDLDQIPARKLPLRYMLDCTGEEDSPLERWIAAEHRILEEPRRKFDAAFPARMEVRTSLHNSLEETYNILVALSRTVKSEAVRHYDKDDWFRWKSLRAEWGARLPAAVFGRRHSRPSDWTMIHVLLAAQTFVHGLHSRLSTITIELDTANMHTQYLRVTSDDKGIIYEYPHGTLSLKERAHSSQFLPFFPGGVRTLHEYFHASSGLDHAPFETMMRGMSSAEDKWRLKVRRGLKCAQGSGIDKLRGMIKYRSTRQDQVTRAFGGGIRRQPTGVNVEQDSGYAKLMVAVSDRIEQIRDGRLKLRSREARDFDDYLKHEVLDAIYVVLHFGRSLQLAKEVDEALRLNRLRDLQETEGQCLELDSHERVHVRVDPSWVEPIAAIPQSSTNNLNLDAGGLDIRKFQRNVPAYVPRATAPIRALSVQWNILHNDTDGLGLKGLERHGVLCDTLLPPAPTADDRADDAMYADWLRRAENPTDPFPDSVFDTPSVNDFLVFILASFQ